MCADSFTPDAQAFDEDGRHVAVVANVDGNFPGSLVQLTHSFHVDGGKICLLEIEGC